jgi:hypothetical protein
MIGWRLVLNKSLLGSLKNSQIKVWGSCSCSTTCISYSKATVLFIYPNPTRQPSPANSSAIWSVTCRNNGLRCCHACFITPAPRRFRRNYSSLPYKFEFEFLKTYNTQKLWKVPDPELRKTLRRAITEKSFRGIQRT